jgi:hypothetical protein
MPLQHTEAQEVELAFRDLADLCLVLVHCQLQLTHDFAQAMQRRFGVAPPAQDHEVIGIVDKASAETSLKAELLPPQHKPAHVDALTVARPARAVRLSRHTTEEASELTEVPFKAELETCLYLKSGAPPEGKNLVDGTEIISPPDGVRSA